MTKFRVTILHDFCTTHDVMANDQADAIETAHRAALVSLRHQCNDEIELGDALLVVRVENLDTGENCSDPEADPEVERLRARVAELEAKLADQWNRAGQDPVPFHPSASHVSPDYRDGWNAALRAEAKRAALTCAGVGNRPPAPAGRAREPARTGAGQMTTDLDDGESPVPSGSVRAIPRKRRNDTGFFNWRGQESIQYESSLERDFLIRQEFTLGVSQVISQPCAISFRTRAGKPAKYTPDFLVVYSINSAPMRFQRRPLLVDIKPRAKLRQHWREWREKWKAARRHAASQGWTFRILDESRIRTQALANIMFLRRYKDYAYPKEEGDRVVETLRELGAASFDYLLARHYQGIYRAEGIGHLWSLLASRRLECDICLPFDIDTELWVPDEV